MQHALGKVHWSSSKLTKLADPLCVKHIDNKFHLSRDEDNPNKYGHATYSEVASKMGGLPLSAFTVTWIRHPVHQCLSAFNWFQVADQGEEATDDNLLKFAQGHECSDYVARYLGMPGDETAEIILKRCKGPQSDSPKVCCSSRTNCQCQ